MSTNFNLFYNLFWFQTVHRFAQFFISPLLKEDSVDREIQAVESGKILIFEIDEHFLFLDTV